MIFFAILIALFLAMNVGASNSSAEMGAAYGAGVRTKKEALTLIAIFAILGAIIAGMPVVKTLGGGLVLQRAFKSQFYIVFVIMGVASTLTLITNVFKVTVPATYAIVGSIVGLGLYHNSLSTDKVLMILKWWVISPLLAFVIAFIVGKVLHLKVAKVLNGANQSARTKAFLGTMLSFSGCYVAFAGGANGAGKAMGPIVAAGMIDNRWGVLLGGVGIAVGALIFGGTALKNDDKEMVEIGFERAILIEIICATVLLLACFQGIPISVSVTATSCLIGLGCADLGFWQSAKKHHIIKTGFSWVGTPLLSIGLTFFLLHVLSRVLK